MPVTREQAQMLATLACQSRPHHAPKWDPPGVMAALAKVAHLHLADVALATFRAADDKTLNTPAPIGIPSSSCWRERGIDRPVARTPYTPEEFCGTCGRARGYCVDHEFRDVIATKRAAVPSQVNRLRAAMSNTEEAS